MASEAAAPAVTGKRHGVRLGIVRGDLEAGCRQGTPEIGRNRRGDGDDSTATTLFGWSTFVVMRAVRGSENC